MSPLPRNLRAALNRKLSEAAFQPRVVRYLEQRGWWVYVAPPAVVVCQHCRGKNFRKTRKGWPDIVALKGGRALFIEVKAETGWLDPEQRVVGGLLEQCGMTVLRLRPRDWDAFVEIEKGKVA